MLRKGIGIFRLALYTAFQGVSFSRRRKRTIFLLFVCSHSDRTCVDVVFLLFSPLPHHSPTSWAHRKWILRRLFSITTTTTTDTKESYLRRELQTCTKVAQAFPKNYYAWTHRAFCCRLALTLHEDWTSALLVQEMATIGLWLRRQPSDHYCSHYGAQVLELLLLLQWDDVDHHHLDPAVVFHQQQHAWRALNVARDLLKSNILACHEAIWRYRRLCSWLLIKWIATTTKNPPPCWMRNNL